MDFVKIHRLFFRALDLIEDENESTIIKRVQNKILSVWRVAFCIGVFLQDAALFTAAPPELKPRIQFLALTLSKILIKGIVFLM